VEAGEATEKDRKKQEKEKEKQVDRARGA